MEENGSIKEIQKLAYKVGRLAYKYSKKKYLINKLFIIRKYRSPFAKKAFENKI